MEDSGGIFLQALPEILQALVGEKRNGGGGYNSHSLTASLTRRCNVDGSFEA